MDPIESFFARFPRVLSDRTDDWRQLRRFNALAKRKSWDNTKRSEEFERLKQAWTEAAESEFEGSSISHYQRLCEDLEIHPLPETVTECKAELKTVFVNIVDLMEYRRRGRRGRKPRKFMTLEQLKEYSSEERKYYPKETAKAEMLRELLKELL